MVTALVGDAGARSGRPGGSGVMIMKQSSPRRRSPAPNLARERADSAIGAVDARGGIMMFRQESTPGRRRRPGWIDNGPWGWPARLLWRGISGAKLAIGGRCIAKFAPSILTGDRLGVALPRPGPESKR